LNELPESLDETYERTLLGIEKEKREFSHRLFQCLAIAVRPLRVDELAEVLAIRFDPGQLPQYHVDWQLDDAQEAVLSTCSSLISVVIVDGSPVVQFSHFSVKEFLTSDRLAKSTEDLSRYHILPNSAHTILAEASLSVLLHLGDQVDKDNVKNFPFAQYAAQHWIDHGRFEDVSSRIEDAMERLFDMDEPSFATWIWIYDVDYPLRQHMFEDRPPRPEASALYYATLCGFRNLVEHLIGNYPGTINTRGGQHGSALNAALGKRNMDIAVVLLGQGADVNIKDTPGHAPLYSASDNGRRDLVDWLLKHHADVNLLNGERAMTALRVAAEMGELEISRALLHHGAAVDTPCYQGWTPLKAASRNGHVHLVQLLMESGAAVNTRDGDGWTPLKEASRYGHLDTVRLLIQSGAAVNTPDNKGWTPLESASRYGHLDIVRLLIHRGADVETPDNDGWTPLMVASRNSHLPIAQVLIDHGANINAQDTDLFTPLHHSSIEGHLSIVELLIRHDMDVHKRNKDQQTPLDLAVSTGRLDISRLLLKSGSSPNSQDNNGSIPLHTAAQNGHLDLVKLLVESGADVNVRNAKNQIPLDVALASRQREVTRYLAGHMGVMDPCDGMDISPSDETPYNLVPDASLTSDPVGIAKCRIPHGGLSLGSLHDACAKGCVKDVQSLLDQGSNVNGLSTYHKTALYVASKNGKLEVVKLLIKYGADVNCRDKFGWTPLMLASRYGHLDIAELLLDHGADVNAKKEELWTALHLASLNGHLEIVKVLLDRGADMHARNIDGRTPSGLASRVGYRDIIQLLSGVKAK
jgi:ankyrin repeat protein